METKIITAAEATDLTRRNLPGVTALFLKSLSARIEAAATNGENSISLHEWDINPCLSRSEIFDAIEKAGFLVEKKNHSGIKLYEITWPLR